MNTNARAQANDAGIYDRNHGDWRARGNKLSALDKLNSPRFKYFDRLIPDWSDLQVLDIGCGAGFTAEFLAKRGAQVSGIDPSELTLRFARVHAEAEKLDIAYRSGKAERIPYPDAKFDMVICVDVLEHVADLEKSLQEAWRVLKPGGYLLFDTINRTLRAKWVMIWLLEDVLNIIPRGAHDWKMFIPPEYLSQLLERIGFERIRLSGFPFRSIMYIGTAQKGSN